MSEEKFILFEKLRFIWMQTVTEEINICWLKIQTCFDCIFESNSVYLTEMTMYIVDDIWMQEKEL